MDISGTPLTITLESIASAFEAAADTLGHNEYDRQNAHIDELNKEVQKKGAMILTEGVAPEGKVEVTYRTSEEETKRLTEAYRVQPRFKTLPKEEFMRRVERKDEGTDEKEMKAMEKEIEQTIRDEGQGGVVMERVERTNREPEERDN